MSDLAFRAACPFLACGGSGQGVTVESSAATPGGRCIVRAVSAWSPSGRAIVSVKLVNAPACTLVAPAEKAGVNGSGSAHGAPSGPVVI